MWVTQGVPNERHSPLVSFEYLRLISVNSVFSVVNNLPRAWPKAMPVLSEGADFWAKCPRAVRGAWRVRLPPGILVR